MRIATGCISHETSTFTTVQTTWANYEERFGYLKGMAILDTFRGTNTPIGGFIEGADVHGFELVPSVFAQPHPSGPTPRDIFDRVVGELVDGIAAAGPIDGVLLELHGSMVAEGADDGEGHILSTLRDRVGNEIPVVAQLDIHSNVSEEMVGQADVLIGRETYPEVDMAARGRECADVLVRILKEGLKPTMALHRVPMIWGMNQVTAHPPMKELIERLHEIESRDGVVCASVHTGFALADIPQMGSSVSVVTHDDQDAAQRLADELGKWIYDRKETWQLAMPSAAEALDVAEKDGQFPVIIADREDNTGGGAPGDSTGVLRTFVERDLQDACVLYIVDPDAVAECHLAGAGTTVGLEVGGKAAPQQGTPVRMTAEVVAVSDGAFRYDGPMYEGLDGSMGPSAHIRERGVHVLLVTEREQPFCTGFSRTLGLDPRRMRYIAVKSAAHFRSGFESWAGAIHVVSEPCVHSPEGGLVYRRLGRKVYPIDA